MKKVFSILAMAMCTLGLFSCEADSTADQEELYIDSPDGHDIGEMDRK